MMRARDHLPQAMSAPGYRRGVVPTLALLAALLVSPPDAAAELVTGANAAREVVINGAKFAPQSRSASTPLALCGTALLRYKMLIKAYAAALYLDPTCPAARVLDDIPKRLEIEYFWAISAADFAAATERGIAANVSAETLETLRPGIAQINALYRDVRPGDRYALSYTPGRGTELALNGDSLGMVPGADFAAAMFGIWLGDRPLDNSFKIDLLARR